MLQESQRQLILQSELSVVVFGKGEDFALLRCNEPASGIEEAHDAGQRGMTFCGVLGLTEDGPKADICPNPEALSIMMLAGFEFALMVAARMKRKQTDDFVRFAEGLHRLPDERTDA
jgi:hypothetical protein